MSLFSILGGLGGGGIGGITGLLGGHGRTLVDTGAILGEQDLGTNEPIVDLDLMSNPQATHQPGAIDVGILPGPNLIDADLLSGSYGANNLIVADVGPDGFGPILTGEILANPDNPLDLQLLGAQIPDVGGLLGGLGGGALGGLGGGLLGGLDL